MGRSVEISGTAIVYVFYAVSLAIVPLFAYFVVWPLDDLASVLAVVLLAALVVVAVADFWYWKSGDRGDHLDTAARRNLGYDITHDPTADPGQAAKQRWLKAVRRLPGRDDEEE